MAEKKTPVLKIADLPHRAEVEKIILNPKWYQLNGGDKVTAANKEVDDRYFGTNSSVLELPAATTSVAAINDLEKVANQYSPLIRQHPLKDYPSPLKNDHHVIKNALLVVEEPNREHPKTYLLTIEQTKLEGLKTDITQAREKEAMDAQLHAARNQHTIPHHGGVPKAKATAQGVKPPGK